MTDSQSQIGQIVKSALTGHDEHVKSTIDIIENNFCKITPPEIPKLEHKIQYITVKNGGISGGKSIKPGNIVLNWKSLLGISAGSALTIATLASPPVWIVCLAALAVWCTFLPIVDVNLTKEQAITILCLWRGQKDKKILEDDALKITNDEMRRLGFPLMTKIVFAAVLNELVDMKCIQIKNGVIIMKESVKRQW